MVKKASIKGSWKVLVKLKVKVLVEYPAQVMNMNRKPPTTGAGMQYLSKSVTFFLIQKPMSSRIPAMAVVMTVSVLMVRILSTVSNVMLKFLLNNSVFLRGLACLCVLHRCCQPMYQKHMTPGRTKALSFGILFCRKGVLSHLKSLD